MAYKVAQMRRDTVANWTSNNPTLAEGEWGYETDTGKAKIGDGSTVWTSLTYFAAGEDVSLSAYTDEDSDGNTLLKSTGGAPHTYLAVKAGTVYAYVQLTSYAHTLKIYVGTTNDPVGAGDLIQPVGPRFQSVSSQYLSVNAEVAEGEYFEVTAESGTPVIRWKSRGTLSKPIDQD